MTGVAAMAGAANEMMANPATTISSARRTGLRIRFLLVRVDLLAAGAASTLGSPILGDAGEVCHTRPAVLQSAGARVHRIFPNHPHRAWQVDDMVAQAMRFRRNTLWPTLDPWSNPQIAGPRPALR